VGGGVRVKVIEFVQSSKDSRPHATQLRQLLDVSGSVCYCAFFEKQNYKFIIFFGNFLVVFENIRLFFYHENIILMFYFKKYLFFYLKFFLLLF